MNCYNLPVFLIYRMQSFQFLFDLPTYQASQHPQPVAGALWRQGIQARVSSSQLVDLMHTIALRLLAEGMAKGDMIILQTEKYSIEWIATDMAIMEIGAISVPLSFPLRKEEMHTILQRIEPSLFIYSGKSNPENESTTFPAISFDELTKSPSHVTDEDLEKLNVIRDGIQQHDIATIVHTSGSSGEPRAVMLSHYNVISNLLSLLSLVPFTPGTRVISFLPLSHIFERIVCYVYLATGANIYFIDSYRYALWALKDVRPDYFTSVPLILERFAAIMEERIEEASWLTRWAYNAWEKTDKGIISHVGSIIAHQWIIKRWKKKMGGRIKGIISGAAYLDPKVEKLYERSGIQIRQGYGLTEASPVVSINRFEPGGHRRGTAGIPLPGVKVKIANDGEVLVKGPNVMLGYYRDEEATRQVIQDGWLHTGDIGRWEKEDFLVITDRKSNIYKHASGKFISPAQIEATLLHHPVIQQAMIIGFMKPYTTALIIPDFEALQKVCVEKGIHWTAPQYMIHNTLVIQLYRDVLDHLDLHSHERIEKFSLLADSWTVEDGLLTSTYKPRRKEIIVRYKKVVEEMYPE